MMEFTDWKILGDVDDVGTITVLEGSNHDSAEFSANSSSEIFMDEGTGTLSKGKAKVHDMLPPFPPNAKRPCELGVSSEVCEDKSWQKIVETNHSGRNGVPFGLAPGHCDETDDISTESDEALEDNCKHDSADVTRNLIHMVKGNGKSLSSSPDHNADFWALKENMLDGGGNLTQELLDSIGLGKPCSCSFCLKAAHMWMDLTVQDTRSRLTELQKSKKRATDQIAKVTQDFSKLSKPTKLEIDLMQHWKMIFVHTHDGLLREISKTRSDLQARGKMMESCKRELESRSGSTG